MGMKMARATRTMGGWVPALIALAVALEAPSAAACGGFFCGQQPVDQTAERILFEVGQSSVTMTTQISFSGDADDFAWVLPLSEVPLEGSLEVWHQQALNALDANTGPVFFPPNDPACYSCLGCDFALPGASPALEEAASEPPPVEVFIRQEVGEYDVAVIGSEDPTALIQWLNDEGYRITPPMEPYIERYTSEGLKFLALKLLDTADVKDLSPFRFTLPGTTPTIPLRMTALAAEPEMSILTFVLASERFEGKNWANLEIPDDQIRYNPTSAFATTVSTNWPRLVAQAVDEADGQGWVTELAGPSANYTNLLRSQVQNGNFATPEDAEAAADLLAAFEAYPYLTRLYTRVSAEEMTSDPVFGRTTLGNVAREHQLSRFVNGIDQCGEDMRASTDPCDFATCGAGGLCRRVSLSDDAANAMGMSAEIIAPGCACLPGATARATFAPDGSPTVICQDGRMSFLNAGDRDEATGEVLPDACAGFDCGDHGQCTAMNMTPTCVCDRGFVAVGSFDPSGARRTRCVAPSDTVPSDFYEKRLPLLPQDLPGGREVMVPAAMPPVVNPPLTPEPVPSGEFPMPRENPDFGGSGTPSPMTSGGGGGCAMSPRAVAPGAAWAPWLLAASFAAAGVRRRRSRRVR
jgi:hypothetical protein